MSFRKAVAGVEGVKQGFDVVDESAFVENKRGEVLVLRPDRLDYQRARAGPGNTNDFDIRGEGGEGGEQALHGHAILAVEDAPTEFGVGEIVLEDEEAVATHNGCNLR